MFHTKWVPTIIPEELRKQHPDYVDIKKLGEYIHYKKPVGKKLKNAKDYLRYIADYSDGLSKTGLLFLNQSVEAFMYSVFGSRGRGSTSKVGGTIKKRHG
jgi:hypothetical protein